MVFRLMVRCMELNTEQFSFLIICKRNMKNAKYFFFHFTIMRYLLLTHTLNAIKA